MSDMGEPFASSIGTANLLRHLDNVNTLLERYNTISGPEPRATDLLEQVKDLAAVTSELDNISVRERRRSAHLRSFSAADLVQLHSVCNCAAEVIQECIEFVEPLRSSVEDILHEQESLGYTAAAHRLGDQAWYDDIFEALKIRTDILQILFSAISLLHQKNDGDEDGNLPAEARSLASKLQYQIAFINPKLHGSREQNTAALQRAVAAATGATLNVPSSLNKHFLVGRSAKSFYTGRARQMAKLKAALEDATYPGQRRFVIYGLGGSGKTELALKYAEEYQQNYWGVFFVDGTSQKTASGSYSEIAKVGGVEPNDKAAKNWLTIQVLPWLLIIDNVDDDEVKLEELLPAGTQGCILITSRNPAHKVYGTVGERHMELLPMEAGEANELLLKAAEEPSPWPESVTKPASAICQALGFLPLALVHAGKSILLGLCSWTGYLKFYEHQVQRIRRHRRGRSVSAKRSHSEEDGNIAVFSSYEILYQSLESSQKESFQDAVELLNMFAYFHFQNIRLDILILATTNPLREAAEREREAKEDETLRRHAPKPRQKRAWLQLLRELAARLAGYFDTPPPLPAALRNPDGLSGSVLEGEVHVRLSEALKVLLSRSLVMKQDRLEDRYSMHPLVHKWVRERPEMPTSQQALWCQVAATTLARSILLPPLGDTEKERSFRRELLPHINHVRDHRAIINHRLKENRNSRRTALWPALDVRFGRHQANELARFSRVYSECGLFHEALELQTKVHSFVTQMLGEEHPLSIKLALVVAGTLWELSRASEATDLQQRAHQICVESLGQDHPLTLKVADLLGSALCWKGRWSRALALHQTTVEGMKRVYGPDHEITLKAISNLARVHLRYMEFEQAAELHEQAWKGMKKRLGESHVDTLVCLEDLAMSRMRLGDRHLAQCHEMMTFVLDHRRTTLGKEQPYTLLAICNLGRVKSAMGQHGEAARIMSDAVAIAERNLGEDHFGVLAGKTHYAQVLVHLGRFKEAEEILYAVADKPQYRKAADEDGEHPDRIIALWYLVGCLERQGKFAEALEICQGLVTSLQEIGGNGLGAKHKFATMLQDEITKLKGKMQQGKAEPGDGRFDVPGEL
ncbi:hypothetical protein VTK56DRAFT_8245 [Thermocarpiscus australiensis]